MWRRYSGQRVAEAGHHELVWEAKVHASKMTRQPITQTRPSGRPKKKTHPAATRDSRSIAYHHFAEDDSSGFFSQSQCYIVCSVPFTCLEILRTFSKAVDLHDLLGILGIQAARYEPIDQSKIHGGRRTTKEIVFRLLRPWMCIQAHLVDIPPIAPPRT